MGLFHFLLTCSRQHRGVAFSLGEGPPECQDESRHQLAPGGSFFCQPGEPGTSAQTYSCWGFEGPAPIDSAVERSYSAQAALCVVAVIANAGAIGVLAFSRLPVHPANTKANNRAMILIRAIPILSVTPVYRLCIGGFLPRRFVPVRFGHADGLRWWRGRGPDARRPGNSPYVGLLL